MAREASLHPISEKYMWNDCGLYPASIKEAADWSSQLLELFPGLCGFLSSWRRAERKLSYWSMAGDEIDSHRLLKSLKREN
ncbi:hypothetical protein TNCV_3889841 [Trichonephila clavipes]|nr:hypothetical protein TNCV_3889841 [Trichonephila clavipes]